MLTKRKRKNRRRLAAVFAAAAAAVGFIVPGLDSRLIVRQYEIHSDKLSGAVRLALITDFHSCNYGEGQSELVDAVRAQKPDFILLGGDIIDDAVPPGHALELAEILAKEYPCYYVTGNHELWSGKSETYKASLRALGVTVLEGDRLTLSVRGQSIDLCGLDDPDVGEDAWSEQLSNCAAGAEGRYTILLSHRPERIETYLSHPFDLILSGHAHGGQWRLPGLINGLIAPNQGLFPQYAGGRYDFEDTAFIVSRGLARETTRIPRFYNRPELVVVDLMP